MPKINVYLPDALAEAVRDAQVPVSAVCQAALERAVREVTSMRNADGPGPTRTGLGTLARFTPRAQAALGKAEEAARAMGAPSVGTEHLLLGVLEEGSNLALRVLTAMEIEPDDLQAELIASASRGKGAPKGELPFSADGSAALEETAKEALALGHNYVGCEHLLLGLLAVEDGLASKVLRRLGLELRTTRRAVVSALTGVVHAAATERARDASTQATLQQILTRLDAIERRIS